MQVELAESLLRHAVSLPFESHPGRVAAAPRRPGDRSRPADQGGVSHLPAQARAHRAGLPAPREELDHAGQPAGSVERAERPAHHLQALHERRGQLFEVHRPALRVGGVVQGDAVEQHEGEVRVAAPDARVGHAAPAAAAQHVQTRHPLQQIAHAARTGSFDLRRLDDGHRGRRGGDGPRDHGGGLVEDGFSGRRFVRGSQEHRQHQRRPHFPTREPSTGSRVEWFCAVPFGGSIWLDLIRRGA